MTTKNLFKTVAIVILAILILGLVGLWVWSIIGTYPAGQQALQALQSTEVVRVIQDEWIVFAPTTQTETGLIFYPGGLVDPRAYSPILKSIAENGFLVIIAPMPLNLAILDTGTAEEVIVEFPEISQWIIAGHSLGGAAASIYVENQPGEVSGIAFWDSYPADSADLSDNNLETVSIFGTNNGIPNTEDLDDKRHLLPPDTEFLGLEGANHSQFGDYGFQKGDVQAAMSMEEQFRLVTEIMVDFLADFR